MVSTTSRRAWSWKPDWGGKGTKGHKGKTYRDTHREAGIWWARSALMEWYQQTQVEPQCAYYIQYRAAGTRGTASLHRTSPGEQSRSVNILEEELQLLVFAHTGQSLVNTCDCTHCQHLHSDRGRSLLSFWAWPGGKASPGSHESEICVMPTLYISSRLPTGGSAIKEANFTMYYPTNYMKFQMWILLQHYNKHKCVN